VVRRRLFAAPKGLAIGLLLAWALPIDLLARIGLQERDRRTGGLVFTASGIVPRLLAARFAVGLFLLLALSLPALLRVSAAGALAVLAVAASLASWGLALGAVTRNARLFELLLVGAVYAALQGAAILDVGVAGAMATATRHAWGLLPAWLLLAWAWPRLARA
jgi:hypothetical protein